jgi:hypothetical protein
MTESKEETTGDGIFTEWNYYEDPIDRILVPRCTGAKRCHEINQSHEASHMLSQSPSAPTDTEMDDLRELLQNEEGYQAPTDRKQTQSGQNRD